MDLLNRYLQAVKFWLPTGQQEDIAAELREDLQSRIDERQESVGRKLHDTEIAAVLKECGRPVVVASRYRPQQSLIGPVLLPIYYFVLKMIAVFYLLPWVVVFFSLMAFSQTYRAAHPWGEALLGAFGSLWSISLTIFGAVTITFAILERAQAKSGFMEKWDPIKLPAVRNTRQIKRSSSIAEIIANIIFGLWWLSDWNANTVLWPNLRIALAPVWHTIFWGLIVIASANIALAIVNLLRPSWTLPRAFTRLALDIAGSGFFCWFVRLTCSSASVRPSFPPRRPSSLLTPSTLPWRPPLP